jgi:hypothetical protein
MATVDTIQMQANSNGLRTSATALPNHDRNYGYLQNQSVNTLYGKFGFGCSITDYDFTLKACTAAADGTGGNIYFKENGVVTVAGTGLSYTAFER